MTTSKLVIKHPDGEEVEIVVGREYMVKIEDGAYRRCIMKTKYTGVKGDLCGEMVSIDGNENYRAYAHQLHNLSAKTTRPMTQPERLAVLRGGCEVKTKGGVYRGCGCYSVSSLVLVGGDDIMELTHYRCAPDWTVEREFTVEVEE